MLNQDARYDAAILNTRSNLEFKEEHMPYQPYLAPAVALIAGILILIQPTLLNIIVAIYLIAIGILGLMWARPRGWFGR